MVIIIIKNILYMQNILTFHIKKIKIIFYLYNFNILDNDENTLGIINLYQGEKIYYNDT